MLAAGSVSVVRIVALMHLVAFAAPPQGKSIVGEWRGSWFERDREAALSGKTLTFVTPASEAAFTIEGTWMHGTVRSQASGRRGRDRALQAVEVYERGVTQCGRER